MNPLPFSYTYDKLLSVKKQSIEYIEKNKDIDDRIFEISWAYHAIGNIIPHTNENIWSGHYLPYNESYQEFEVLFLLCLQGLYKQAMTSLRSMLETGMLSVYYNINDEGHNTVQGWLYSEEGKENETPIQTGRFALGFSKGISPLDKLP